MLMMRMNNVMLDCREPWDWTLVVTSSVVSEQAKSAGQSSNKPGVVCLKSEFKQPLSS